MRMLEKRYQDAKKYINNPNHSQKYRAALKKRFSKNVRKQFKCSFIFKKLSINGDRVLISGLLLVRPKNFSVMHTLLSLGELHIGEHAIPVSKLRVYRIPKLKYRLFKVRYSGDYDNLSHNRIHTPIRLALRFDEDFVVRKKIPYSLLAENFDSLKSGFKNKRVSRIPAHNTAMYFRQSSNNGLFLTIREIKKTDSQFEQIKLSLAWLLSFPAKIFWSPVILFEKESSRFEESASVVFDKLVKMKIHNTYFILNPEYKEYSKLKNKYGKRILPKYSFKHYLAFFTSNTFLGSEVIAHSIDLRVANSRAARKIINKKIRYVFLQHGVMYMISLDSHARKANRKNGGVFPPKSKIVVSSLLEAEHFVMQGRYNPRDLYISGLPKFDLSTRVKNPKKIVIMPTWRPWEYNIIRSEPESSTYYKMISDIFNSVPDNLRKYVVILPHPLFKSSTEGTPLEKYVETDKKYDDVLKETALLITDYSSIAYDAFYRGANVLFWWKEKDECMKQYRGHLMLDEDNVFGDIANSSEDLRPLIVKQCKSKQKKTHQDKYRKIVQFNDNQNTERLIKMLQKDKII